MDITLHRATKVTITHQDLTTGDRQFTRIVVHTLVPNFDTDPTTFVEHEVELSLFPNEGQRTVEVSFPKPASETELPPTTATRLVASSADPQADMDVDVDDEEAPCIHCGAYGGDHDDGCSYHPDMVREAGPGAPAPQRTGSCKACGQEDELHRVEDDCVLCPPPADAVHIDTRTYEFSHGKKPHGEGNWCFSLVNGQGNTVADVWHNGTYTDATKVAVSRARLAGVVDVVVGS